MGRTLIVICRHARFSVNRKVNVRMFAISLNYPHCETAWSKLSKLRKLRQQTAWSDHEKSFKAMRLLRICCSKNIYGLIFVSEKQLIVCGVNNLSSASSAL